MLIIGLTGNIATGKSTVSSRLHSQYNIPIIDADLIARQIVLKGQPACKEILSYFGPIAEKEQDEKLLLDSGELNRPVLGKLVFGNPERLRKLNSITHKRVGQEIFKSILKYYLQGYSMVILDIPLLFEASFHYICGTIINVVVDSSDIQLNRLLSRNPELSASDASKRIASQLPMEIKSKYSDYVINNTEDGLENLWGKIDTVMQKVTPNKYWSLLEWLTPLGFVMGSWRLTGNFLWRFKGFEPKKNK